MPSIGDLVEAKHDVIIGGGLIGAFTYPDCALRCLNSVLFAKGDFGGETTSYNTRLAHGGIRYIARKDDWPLAIEFLRERHILRSIASRLVNDMEFILRIYDGCIDFTLTIESILTPRVLTGRLKRLIQTNYPCACRNLHVRFARGAHVYRSDFFTITNTNDIICLRIRIPSA